MAQWGANKEYTSNSWALRICDTHADVAGGCNTIVTCQLLYWRKTSCLGWGNLNSSFFPWQQQMFLRRRNRANDTGEVGGC
jgi:hypothetical protein